MTDISCKLPWIVNFVRINDDLWKFCCKVIYNDFDGHNTVVKEVKEYFLDGKKHPACESCWREESKGGVSFRMSEGAAVSTIDVIRDQPPISIIDLEFGDVCNMYCLTCGPENSTKWKNILKIQPQQENKFDATWEKLKNIILNNPIQHINMHGGEPSMDPNFNKLVNNLISIGFNKKLRVITNGNYSGTLRTKFEASIDKLISNGITVELIFSLDSAGVDGEWLRGGLNIETWKSNILKMSEKNVQLATNISISILNLENHIQILYLLEELKLLDRVIIKINTVNTPHYFSISNLGSATKDFLPKNWPTTMSDAWLKYYITFNKFIKLQLDTSVPPDRSMISNLLSVIKNYEKITGNTLTEYYVELTTRLSKLIE